jgi:hypothetical protein
MRESVFTQLARAINSFANHTINKMELYKIVVGLIEIADSEEKAERGKFQKKAEEWKKLTLSEMRNSEIPYSSYESGIKILSE